MRNPCLIFVLLITLGSVLLWPSDAATAQEFDRGFVLQVGQDTLAVERYARTENGLRGELVSAVFGRTIYEWVIADGRVQSATVQAWRPGNLSGAPAQTASITVRSDSTIVRMHMTSGERVQRFSTEEGAAPYLNPSIAQLEDILIRRGGDANTSFEAALFILQGGTTVRAAFDGAGSDSVTIAMAGGRMHLHLGEDGLFATGEVPAQRLRIWRDDNVAFPAALFAPPDYSAPDGAPYAARDVEVVAADGHRLVGTLTMPLDVTGPVPAVVTITGSGPQDRDQAIPGIPGYRPFRDVADALSRRGIAVLRLDDRGTGASTGDFSAATSADFAQDIRDAVAHLRSMDGIDPDRIGLAGHSEGGMIAPMVAATDERLAGIALIAGPAYSGRDIIDFQIRSAIGRDTTVAPAARDSIITTRIAEIDSLAGTNPWMAFFYEHDPLAVARTVPDTPVLIVHGERDLQVTFEQAAILADAFRSAGNPGVTVVVLPDVNHLLLRDRDGHPANYSLLVDREVVPEVLDAVAEWFEAVFSVQ